MTKDLTLADELERLAKGLTDADTYDERLIARTRLATCVHNNLPDILSALRGEQDNHGEGEPVAWREELAQFLHDECEDWPDKIVGRAWPEHDGDDGYRGGGGYVKLQAPDVIARFRDVASRIIRRFPALTRPVAWPEGYKLVPVEALEEVRDLLMERRHGNPARSPGHNARLAVEALLSPSDGAGQVGEEG